MISASHIHILVTHTDAPVRFSIARTLARAGFHVHQAATPEQATDLLTRWTGAECPVDLLIRGGETTPQPETARPAPSDSCPILPVLQPHRPIGNLQAPVITDPFNPGDVLRKAQAALRTAGLHPRKTNPDPSETNRATRKQDRGQEGVET